MVGRSSLMQIQIFVANAAALGTSFQSLIKLSSNHWASELDTPKSKLSKLKSKCEEAAEDWFWVPLQEATATPIIEVTVVVLAPAIFLGGGDKRWQVELLLAYDEVEDRLSHFVEEDVAEAEEGWDGWSSSRSLLIQVTWNYEQRRCSTDNLICLHFNYLSII